MAGRALLDLDALVDAIAERVAEKLAARERPPSPYYTQDTAPVPKRTFLEAARRGEFASFTRGKTVLARREDVDAWVTAGTPRRKPAAPPQAPANDTDDPDADNLALLAAAGCRPSRGRVR